LVAVHILNSPLWDDDLVGRATITVREAERDSWREEEVRATSTAPKLLPLQSQSKNIQKKLQISQKYQHFLVHYI